uniref:Uncharacterized protein n=1 Tax=Biomphalaria glabrata TaxID=6526 RepID=A0A2C9LRK1_BIOGL
MDQKFVVCLIIGLVLVVIPGDGATTTTYPPWTTESSSYPPWRTSESTNSWTARPAYDSTKSVTEGSSVNHIKTFVQAVYASCTFCYTSHLDVLNKDNIFDVCGAFDMFNGCVHSFCYSASVSDNIKDASAICDGYRQKSSEVGVSMSSAMSCGAHWMISALIFIVTLVFRTL